LQVGTLFNTKISEAMAIQAQQAKHAADLGIEQGPEAMARAAREQSRVLASLSSQERSDILLRVADALEKNVDEIMRANQQDVNATSGRIDNNLLQRCAAGRPLVVAAPVGCVAASGQRCRWLAVQLARALESRAPLSH
jgi:hypothetical protein